MSRLADYFVVVGYDHSKEGNYYSQMSAFSGYGYFNAYL